MSKILKRPMFRDGGKANSVGTGITSGLADRENYRFGGGPAGMQPNIPQGDVKTILDYIQSGSGTGPSGPRGRIGVSDYIQPSPYGKNYMSLNHGIHFTGGEPFLNFELLCLAVEMAESMNIPSTFVETNCFWATSDEIVREKLNILKNKGLKGILISVNPFFLEYIPFERTDRVINLSYEIMFSNLCEKQVCLPLASGCNKELF